MDRAAVERRQPVRKCAQLGLGEQRSHLVEPVAGRQLAVVRGERVVELSQRPAGDRRVGERGIVIDVRPERDEQAVDLVRARIDVARRRRDRRTGRGQEVRRIHLGSSPREPAQRAEGQLDARDDGRRSQVHDQVGQVAQDDRIRRREAVRTAGRQRGAERVGHPAKLSS